MINISKAEMDFGRFRQEIRELVEVVASSQNLLTVKTINLQEGDIIVNVSADFDLSMFNPGDKVVIRGVLIGNCGSFTLNTNRLPYIINKYETPRAYQYTKEDLLELINLIKDENLRNITKALTYDESKFHTWKGSTGMHHPYEGGLLQHSCQVTKVAIDIAKHFNHLIIDDVLIAGAIMHDIGKYKTIDSIEQREHPATGAKIFSIKADEYNLNPKLKHLVYDAIYYHYHDIVEPLYATSWIIGRADALSAILNGETIYSKEYQDKYWETERNYIQTQQLKDFIN